MDHFGVLVRLYREPDAQELIMRALDRVLKARGAIRESSRPST
jgi:hypothetical protein